MSNIIKKLQLTTLGACLTLALSAGVVSTAISAANHTDEVSAAQAAKISLKQAITTASKEASGTLISAEFDDDDSDAEGDGGVYELEFSTNTTGYEIKVDAITGKVVKSETENLDKDDVTSYEVQQQAKIKIMDAINTAEKQTSGRVLEIEFENDRDYANHASYYETQLLKGNSLLWLNIDADTGNTFKNKFKK
ncbi:PepSY domain-containing protein [Psychrobacter okhotskensis]|uniref:PepSY domain-containing protein n=1 Tax=Psychrobacter okhotskensis TaxID=212403 RepID=UPI001918EA75|nr:PepSY domain-containing protein [Psychrobacter okhotskensis]